MTATLLMPFELLWRSSPRRWAFALTGCFAAGVAAVFIAAPYIDAGHFDDPFDLT